VDMLNNKKGMVIHEGKVLFFLGSAGTTMKVL